MKQAFTKVPSLKSALSGQIEAIEEELPAIAHKLLVSEVLLIGSCASGTATYRSDIDLLFVLKSGSLNYSRVKKLRDILEQSLGKSAEHPLRCQANFVLHSVYDTQEPAMKRALQEATLLYKEKKQKAKK